MLRAVEEQGEMPSRAPVARQLRDLAERLLAEAKDGPPNHDTALILLAADALVTYQCEATAEDDPALLADLG